MTYVHWLVTQIHYWRPTKRATYNQQLNSYLKDLSTITDISHIETLYKKYLSPSIQKTFITWVSHMKKEWEWLQDCGIQVAIRGHDPIFELFHTRQPLYCLYLQGDWKGVQQYPRLSVVGARKANPEAKQWMDQHLKFFVEQTHTIIVSGGARGIDQKAHGVSLSLGQPTICFLPAGFRHIYPSSLQAWVDPILKNGGVIMSQFAPSQQVKPFHFHLRNQLIASLSPSLLVIQAGVRSGSLMTAQYALSLHRDIGAVPFFPGQGGDGNLLLLESGAQLIRDREDLGVFCGLSASQFSLDGV